MFLKLQQNFRQRSSNNLRVISETAILPVAGLILTYVFCYEIYQLVVEKNRGNDFETGQLLFLIIKTSVMILLLSNSLHDYISSIRFR